MSIAFQLPTLHHEAPTFTQIDDEDDDDDGQEEAQIMLIMQQIKAHQKKHRKTKESKGLWRYVNNS